MKQGTVAKVLALLLVAIVFADAFGAYAVFQSTPAKKSYQPSPSPIVTSSSTPTPQPTSMPTSTPIPNPTSEPTPIPTIQPTSIPTPVSTPVPTASPTPAPTPSPTPTATPTPPQNVTPTMNWAGYVVSSDLQNPQPSATSISASWVVPIVVTSTTNDTYSAIWIGIGGQFNNDSTLIQCGTEQDSIDGQARYFAWFELLPRLSTTIFSMPISPGDMMQASIQLANGTSDQWGISIMDTNSSQQFQRNFIYDSSRLTAEWIVERPTVDGNLSELMDFGNVTFTNCTETINSTIGGIGNFPWEALTAYSTSMSSIGQVQLTDVSDLTPDGLSFMINWLASG